MTRALLALAALAALAAPPVAAQGGTAPPQRVVLVDGTALAGRAVDDSAAVVVVTESGVEQRVPRERVAETADAPNGRFTHDDPVGTRLFASPTARPLGAGAKRVSTYYLFPSFAAGVSDRVDLSVGTTVPLPGVGNVFLNGNAKVTVVQRGGVTAALGTSVLVGAKTVDLAVDDAGNGRKVYGFDPTDVGGTVYGLVTVGGEASAVTVGAYGVYSFYVSDFGDLRGGVGDGAVLLVGLERQVSNRLKLVSENYLVASFNDRADPTYGTLTGVRYFGDRFAVDVAAAFAVIDGEFLPFPLPYVGASYAF